MILLREQYRATRARWSQDPLRYVHERLGMRPTWIQAEIIGAMAQPGAKVAIRSGHSCGKTSSIAGLVLWALECLDGARIPVTAPSSQQLRDVLFPEISKWIESSDRISEALRLDPSLHLGKLLTRTQDRISSVARPSEVFATARTARAEAPTSLQGFHASEIRISPDGRSIEAEGVGGELIFIAEEASGIADTIFQVVEGALSSPKSRFLMAGNPVSSTGYFADAFRKNRASYTCLHYRSSDSPLSEPGYRADLVRKYGAESNIVRVRADGEFPESDSDTLIGIALTEPSLTREPYAESGPRILGVDPARFGDDRTALVLRQGRNVEQIAVHAKLDLMTTVGRVLEFAHEYKAEWIHVDVVGLGAGVYDRLREVVGQQELPYSVQAVNVAEKPEEERSIFDGVDGAPLRQRDYLWMKVANWFRDESPSLSKAPRDHREALAAELSSVKFDINSSGQMVVEPKSSMKKRGLVSPDLADALGCTFNQNLGGIWARL
jgi:phage terminase large subunit